MIGADRMADAGPVGETLTQLSDLRIAIVHEWLSAAAGSEQTFAAMARLLPNADLFALGRNQELGLDFDHRPVETSVLDRFVQGGGKASVLPFMPMAMARLGRGREYDVVITSSHAFSRAFASGLPGLHLSYTYTPIRYVWHPELERHRSRAQVPGVFLKPFKRLDLRYARDVDSFAAISEEVRSRIAQIYGRDSVIVHPPCDTNYFTPLTDPATRQGALVAGRLVPYKRVDLAIEACAAADVDLTVIGEGPERENLEQLARRVAPGRVHFAGSVPREDLRSAYRTAEVVLFPGLEDFGIVPVEAQACGAPVVAYGAAGALETVFNHPNAFVPEQSADLFARALRSTIDSPPAVSSCRLQAERFSPERFDAGFTSWVLGAVVDADRAV